MAIEVESKVCNILRNIRIFKESVIGVVICSLEQKEKMMLEQQKDGIFPEKFFKLEKFFDDLKGNFGSFDLFESVNIS